jgi:hypothetical protein
MDKEIEKKINNLKEFLQTICPDDVKPLIKLFDNATLYNMIEKLYLELNMTQEQAFNELKDKLKITEMSEDQTYKLKRYIEYFYTICSSKFSNLSYEELLKQLK